MGCYDKKKLTCGTKQFAPCVYYENPDIPEWSDLAGENCVTLDDTTTDIYHHLDEIYDNIDLTELGNDCIDYNEEEPGNIKVKEALKKFEELLCVIQEQLPEPTTFCTDLDYGTLVDSCEVAPNINSQCEFNQFMLDQIIEIRSLIETNTPNNGILTISKNGTPVGTFSADQSGNSTINILIP